jgi:hypothetical protein
MIAALALASVVYHDVPPEVERIAAYEWRAGSPPASLDVGVSREGSRWTVAVPKAVAVVIVLQRRDGRYLLDGPVALSRGDAERRIDDVWRQTAQGVVVGTVVGTPAIEWLSADGAAADVWPACWWTGSTRWACMGVPLDAAGVVIAADGHRLWSTPADARTAVSLRAGVWGRLVVVRDRHGGSLPGLSATAARAVVPPLRTKTVRLEASALPDVRVSLVGRSAVWISGDSSPPAAWVEIRTTRSGPAYVPLADMAEGSPQVAVQVMLDDTRGVNAVVMSDRAAPAAGALVSIFRLIDPPASQGGREPPPRRVFASDAVTDDEGRVRVEGLGDAVYDRCVAPSLRAGIATASRRHRPRDDPPAVAGSRAAACSSASRRPPSMSPWYSIRLRGAAGSHRSQGRRRTDGSRRTVRGGAGAGRRRRAPRGRRDVCRKACPAPTRAAPDRRAWRHRARTPHHGVDRAE